MKSQLNQSMLNCTEAKQEQRKFLNEKKFKVR